MTPLALFVTVTAATIVYLLPFVVAFTRRRPGWVGLLVLNILLGWTIVGWVAVLVRAASTPKPRPPARRRLPTILAKLRRIGRPKPKPAVFEARSEPLVEPPSPDPADGRIWPEPPNERPDPYADWLASRGSP